MRVIIGCEESQRICRAFHDFWDKNRIVGNEAYSCDIVPTRGEHPEWHIQDDVMKHLNDGWDLGIFHPMCINMCNSGVRWIKNPDGSLNGSRLLRCINDGTFLEILLGEEVPVHNITRVCVENPIPHKYAYRPCGAIHRKYDQIIHPWMFGNFGENESKATCLWLNNLPKLIPVNPLSPPHNQSVHRMAPSENRSRERAVTFRGIAEAMASQWGNL